MPPTPKSRFRTQTNPNDRRKSPRPDGPFAELMFAPVLALATLCLLFILYRRAASIRHVVAYQLKNWAGRGEGRIRLSEDETPPPSSESIADDSEDDEIGRPTNISRPQNTTRPDRARRVGGVVRP